MDAGCDAVGLNKTPAAGTLPAALKVSARVQLAHFVLSLRACRYAHHSHHAPAQHELYVFRAALVPKTYSPSSLRAK